MVLGIWGCLVFYSLSRRQTGWCNELHHIMCNLNHSGMFSAQGGAPKKILSPYTLVPGWPSYGTPLNHLKSNEILYSHHVFIYNSSSSCIYIYISLYHILYIIYILYNIYIYYIYNIYTIYIYSYMAIYPNYRTPPSTDVWFSVRRLNQGLCATTGRSGGVGCSSVPRVFGVGDQGG